MQLNYSEIYKYVKKLYDTRKKPRYSCLRGSL